MFTNNLQHFLTMGGYASYVWPAYGIAAVVLVGNFWFGKRQRRLAMQSVRRQQAMNQQHFDRR